MANVVSLRQMPDTSYQLARFKVIGYTIGVIGYLNSAVVLNPVETFFPYSLLRFWGNYKSPQG
ncbi:hypothetical protein A7J58_02530 [Enterobacter cloacae]|nr:hypothetical protein A7J56_02515 [Enterobacter cloacae]OAE69391.1 hypothetical protein A7J58_02530 [Enterobacter cloacae]